MANDRLQPAPAPGSVPRATPSKRTQGASCAEASTGSMTAEAGSVDMRAEMGDPEVCRKGLGTLLGLSFWEPDS